MVVKEKHIIISIVVVLIVAIGLGYMVFLATQCEKFSMGNCPWGCVENCVPSNCEPGGPCTTDCEGGGCLPPKLLR